GLLEEQRLQLRGDCIVADGRGGRDRRIGIGPQPLEELADAVDVPGLVCDRPNASRLACGSARRFGDDQSRNAERNAFVELRRNLNRLILRQYEGQVGPVDQVQRLHGCNAAEYLYGIRQLRYRDFVVESSSMVAIHAACNTELDLVTRLRMRSEKRLQRMHDGCEVST